MEELPFQKRSTDDRQHKYTQTAMFEPTDANYYGNFRQFRKHPLWLLPPFMRCEIGTESRKIMIRQRR